MPKRTREVGVRIEERTGEAFLELAEKVLREVLRELGETEDELSMSLDLVATGRALSFIAFDRQRPVGVLIAEPEPRTRSAFIRWVAVAQDARRRGVGTMLVDALISTSGLDALNGMVDQKNHAAVGFWRERGWTIRTPRPGRRWQPMGDERASDRREAA
jgi:ribosomal protein S18 acetylase RimI-like enzyme